MELLRPSQIKDNLDKLEGWHSSDDQKYIRKSFIFKDFTQAWSFMNKIAQIAEEMNHHPEWTNIYNRVEIALSTHEVGGLTQLDINLASKINTIKLN